MNSFELIYFVLIYLISFHSFYLFLFPFRFMLVRTFNFHSVSFYFNSFFLYIFTFIACRRIRYISFHIVSICCRVVLFHYIFLNYLWFVIIRCNSFYFGSFRFIVVSFRFISFQFMYFVLVFSFISFVVFLFNSFHFVLYCYNYFISCDFVKNLLFFIHAGQPVQIAGKEIAEDETGNGFQMAVHCHIQDNRDNSRSRKSH